MMLNVMALTVKRIRFVQEYCVDFNGTQAAIRAGFAEPSAYQTAYELLRNPEVMAAIEVRKEELAAAAGLTREWVLSQWKQLAEADPNELTQVRRVNCRHCWGINYGFQWVDTNEFEFALIASLKRGKEAPDGLGGFGFDPNKEPNPACPKCAGEGEEFVYVADSRKVKGAARKLFAGVERTKDGLKVKMRDQDAALRNISQYFGMLVERKELSGPGGGPVAVANIAAADLTDEQLAALIAGDSRGGCATVTSVD